MFASFCTFVQIFVLARTRQRVHVQVYAEPCRYLRVSWNLPPFHRESLYKNPFCHHTQCLLYREKPFSICKMPPLAAIVEVLHFWQCWLGSNDCISGQLCSVVLSCSDRKKTYFEWLYKSNYLLSTPTANCYIPVEGHGSKQTHFNLQKFGFLFQMERRKCWIFTFEFARLYLPQSLAQSWYPISTCTETTLSNLLTYHCLNMSIRELTITSLYNIISSW